MSNDPPASALGASPKRLTPQALALLRRIAAAPHLQEGFAHVLTTDLVALLAAYDAQAARLANQAEAVKVVDALVRERDAQAARLAVVDELVEAAKSWATRDYMVDPSKGGLERVKRTDRLVRAARAVLVADGGVWYEVSEFVTDAGAVGAGEARDA